MPLQDAIQRARFAAARYQEVRKPYAQFHAWMNDVEAAARAELGLPGYAGWDRFSAMGDEVVRKVDQEQSVAPGPLVPHGKAAHAVGRVLALAQPRPGPVAVTGPCPMRARAGSACSGCRAR
jgi:hypothetical protein